jgi:hypothetical protein
LSLRPTQKSSPLPKWNKKKGSPSGSPYTVAPQGRGVDDPAFVSRWSILYGRVEPGPHSHASRGCALNAALTPSSSQKDEWCSDGTLPLACRERDVTATALPWGARVKGRAAGVYHHSLIGPTSGASKWTLHLSILLTKRDPKPAKSRRDGGRGNCITLALRWWSG